MGVRNHARSPIINSVLIGVKATSDGLMRDREPAWSAGSMSPILGRVLPRDCFVSLYTSVMAWPCFCRGGCL